MSKPSVIRIQPLCYVHVLNNNTNITRVEIGPQTFTRQQHEEVVAGPFSMVKVPRRHYCVVANPVCRHPDGPVGEEGTVKDEHGNYKLRFGDSEVRFAQEPFPLYPGEELEKEITPLRVVKPNTALWLRAKRNFEDTVEGDEKKTLSRLAGDEWLFKGPGTYIPRVEVEEVRTIRAKIIRENQALKVKARRQIGNRKAGEMYLIRKPGAYLPSVEEEIVHLVRAEILTEKKALHLRAIHTFTDVFGHQRRAGDEWLVTIKDADTYIPDVHEEVVGHRQMTSLNSRQYCVVVNPAKRDPEHPHVITPQYGKLELRKGECNFFLQPGEELQDGIQDVYVLQDDEALLLKAKEEFQDNTFQEPTTRHPGDLWMIHGPRDYIPPIEVTVLEKRTNIPLDENEGIYVRDKTTGAVRIVSGESYMLQANEELWQKDLPPVVEALVLKKVDSRIATKTRSTSSSSSSSSSHGAGGNVRDKTRVVTYRAPHNSAVQVYDFSKKTARVVFGPALVMLGPYEHFTVLELSGGTPKREGEIKSLCLLLGPDFMTDLITVETSDHARLNLQVAYNWYFDVEAAKSGNPSGPEGLKLFSVRDFVGDTCKALASRIRACIASTSFDDLHKDSSNVIRRAIFGSRASDPHPTLRFNANNLVVTNIDIQAVEPVDQRTRDSLQKSVQMAIEITTNAQEAAARHDAQRLEQEAKGKLEKQRIVDESDAEKERTKLLELQATSAAVETTGQATAEAESRAAAALIEGEAAVEQARLVAKAIHIRTQAELDQVVATQETEREHQAQVDQMEVEHAREKAEIEVKKFKQLVKAIGPDTIKEMAAAGPETQAKLLQGLGLKSFLITDGNSPINLFNTADQMIQQQ